MLAASSGTPVPSSFRRPDESVSAACPSARGLHRETLRLPLSRLGSAVEQSAGPQSPVRSRHRPRVLGQKPFARPRGSDTIPIACRPAVQFNRFYPAGPLVPSRGCTPRGPPDKSLFVRTPQSTQEGPVPYLNIKLTGPASVEKSKQVAEVLTNLTAGILKKKRELTAVAVEFVAHDYWYIGGSSLAARSEQSFYLDIKVTGGDKHEGRKGPICRTGFFCYRRHSWQSRACQLHSHP
ncbi:MAG: 4-oxalocrotonate tautomerase family protein [Candidatus Methylomirabilales bacterium]